MQCNVMYVMSRFMAPRDLEKIVHLSIIRSTAGTQAPDATSALATDCSGDQTMACAQTNSMTSTSTRSLLSPPSLNDRSLASLIQVRAIPIPPFYCNFK